MVRIKNRRPQRLFGFDGFWLFGELDTSYEEFVAV